MVDEPSTDEPSAELTDESSVDLINEPSTGLLEAPLLDLREEPPVGCPEDFDETPSVLPVALFPASGLLRCLLWDLLRPPRRRLPLGFCAVCLSLPALRSSVEPTAVRDVRLLLPSCPARDALLSLAAGSERCLRLNNLPIKLTPLKIAVPAPF